MYIGLSLYSELSRYLHNRKQIKPGRLGASVRYVVVGSEILGTVRMMIHKSFYIFHRDRTDCQIKSVPTRYFELIQVRFRRGSEPNCN